LVLHTDHFDVYFYPSERAAAGTAARMAERWHTRLSTVLDHQCAAASPWSSATGPQFRQTNVVSGLGEGTAGHRGSAAASSCRSGTLGDLDHVIGHELTHAFQ
jgi:hypothetical protein